MKIAVVGSGYVGLVASACFAKLGHEVACIDRDRGKIDILLSGRLPIYEPGLQDLVNSGVGNGSLMFGTDLPQAVSRAEAVFIAVGTPDIGDDGRPDLTSVFAVAREIAAAASGFTVVVTKSTVPVGTGDAIETVMSAILPRERFAVVSNPEFLREGRAIEDFDHPDRIVIGADCEWAREVMAQIYDPRHFPDVPMIFTSRRTAELMKYASNAFLAAKIAFINDMSDLCENARANVCDLARGMGLDARIGRDFLEAGPGYGGSCLPKDTRALVRMATDHGAPLAIFEAIVAANNRRKRRLAARIVEACGDAIEGKTIGLLGLTFKANTDDMRESPALPLIEDLKLLGANIRAYDPAGMANAARLVDDVVFTADPYDCANGAHALVIVTGWSEFQALDLQKIRSSLIVPIVIDFRNILDPVEMAANGLAYISVGRASVQPLHILDQGAVLHVSPSLAGLSEHRIARTGGTAGGQMPNQAKADAGLVALSSLVLAEEDFGHPDPR